MAVAASALLASCVAPGEKPRLHKFGVRPPNAVGGPYWEWVMEPQEDKYPEGENLHNPELFGDGRK